MNLREFMEAYEVGEALRLWAYHLKEHPDNRIFLPLLNGDPAIVSIKLIRRKQLRITEAKTYEKELEAAMVDLKGADSTIAELKKEAKDYEKQLSKITSELAKAKEAFKEIEKENRKLRVSKLPKEDKPLENIDS